MGTISYKSTKWNSWYFVREAIDNADNLHNLEMLEFAIREGLPELLNAEFRGKIADILIGKHKGKNKKPEHTKYLRKLDQLIWEYVHYFNGQGYAKYSQSRDNDAITEVCDLFEQPKFAFLAKKPAYETVLRRFKNLDQKKNGAMFLAAEVAFDRGKAAMLVAECNAEIGKGVDSIESIKLVAERRGMTFEAVEKYLGVET